MRAAALVLGLSAAAGALALAPAAAANPVRGQALYESRCSGCHSLDADRIGPRHRGLFGRRAGSVLGFEYSPALRESRIVWDRTTLDCWLENPEALIPGQHMNYQVPELTDRADLIDFLEAAW